MYFGEKSVIFKRESWLSKFVNPTNKSQIYNKEKLPKTDAALKQNAERLNLITTTLISQVKVFRKNCQGVIHSVGVNSLKAVNDIKNTTLPKKKLFSLWQHQQKGIQLPTVENRTWKKY